MWSLGFARLAGNPMSEMMMDDVQMMAAAKRAGKNI
jgi:hypothetical protein